MGQVSTFKEFYDLGFELVTLTETPIKKRLDQLLSELKNQDLKSGFSWEQKYDRSLDLRPSAVEYDDVFAQFIKDQKIDQIIFEKTGRQLKLGHIQVRKSLPGKTYMGWHRDTYKRNNKWVGNTPPVVKLIYYPIFNKEETRPQIYLTPASHRKMHDNYWLDKLLNIFRKKSVIFNHANKALLFDTACFHSVAPCAEGKSEMRLIYSFCLDSQMLT